MKFNFKKIASVLASAVMLTSTIGVGLAANYPSPLVEDGQADGAIVVGSNLPSNLDSAADYSAATDLADDINDNYVDEDSSSSVSVGEESFLISATGDDLTFGEALNSVSEDLDDGDLPDLLARRTLEDDSVDYDEEEEVDYSQEITLSDDEVVFDELDDDDYVINTDAAENEEPVIYLDQSEGKAYDLYVDFATKINATAYDDSESITLFGKELTFDQEMEGGETELTLFESSETITLDKGESVTVDGDEIELTGGESGTANLKINGEIETIDEGESEEGYYANKVVFDDTGDGSVSVELFAGAEEWVLTDGEEVEIEGDDIDGTSVSFQDGFTSVEELEEITITVTPSEMDEDELSYLEVGEAFEDPLFDLGIAFDSVEPELKSEDKGTINLESSDSVGLEFTSRNGNEYGISPFEISEDETNVTAGEDWYANGSTYTGLEEDDIFIASDGRDPGASYAGSDGESEETLVYQVVSINDNDDSPSIEFEDLSSSEDNPIKVYEGDELGNTGLYVPSTVDSDTFDLQDTADSTGSAAPVNNQIVTEDNMRMALSNEVTIDASSATDGDTLTINGVVYEYSDTASASGDEDYSFGPGDAGSGVDYDSLSEALDGTGFDDSDGQAADDKATLSGFQVDTVTPTGSITASNDATILMEEDQDGVFNLDSSNIARGDLTVSITADEDDGDLEMRDSDSTNFEDVSNSDTDLTYAVSELGTYYEIDTDDRNSLDIWTPTEGQTVYNIYVSGEMEEDDSGNDNEVTVTTDDDMSDVENKNLIVVGGSCVNDLAAEILEVDSQTCGSDFTEASGGVESGNYLIKAVESPYNDEKVAVLAAGYSASDTEDAVGNLMEGHTTDVGTDEIYPQASD